MQVARKIEDVTSGDWVRDTEHDELLQVVGIIAVDGGHDVYLGELGQDGHDTHAWVTTFVAVGERLEITVAS